MISIPLVALSLEAPEENDLDGVVVTTRDSLVTSKLFIRILCIRHFFFPFFFLDICYKEPKRGLCKALIPRWHFNARNGICQIFSWGGCGDIKNENNFKYQSECYNACLYNRRYNDF